MSTIVCPLYKRFDYTKTVLEAMDKCYGIENYTVKMFLEPGFPEIQKLAETIGTFKREVKVNETRLGCNQNVFRAMNEGFKSDDTVIIFEDDVVPAQDTLKYFDSALRNFKDDPSFLTICAYSNPDEVLKEDFHKIYKQAWFTPWGWATWKDRWEKLAKIWAPEGVSYSWDGPVNEYRKANNLYELRPVLARTQNIGAEQGSWVPSAKWHRKFQFNQQWAGYIKDLDKDPAWVMDITPPTILDGGIIR